MLTVEQKLEKVNVELEELRKQYQLISDQIQIKCKLQEKLLLVINEDNLKDPAWLIKNPTMPGAHEATKELVEKHYGGEYNGPHPSGYHHDGKYNPIQKNFDFSLRDYSKTGNREVFYKNCLHFIENFLSLLEPVMQIESRWNNKFPEMKVVPFNFRSEPSGLDYLGYEPVEKVWYHYVLRYGNTDVERKFKSFDEAFDFAFKLVNTEEDDDYCG
jgi:hypothetical protein